MVVHEIPKSVDLTAEQVSDIRLAASQMTGSNRRSFMAEIALKYCKGSARQSERVFGWDRNAVACGLGERRSGIECVGSQSSFGGRPRWEEKHPEAAGVLRELAEFDAQQDPTFSSTVAYTRLTAQAALAGLREQGVSETELPSASAMAKILNRMGYRLRKVVKAKPQKKIKETDAIFENIKKKTRQGTDRDRSNG